MKTQKLFSRLLVWLSIFLLFSFTQLRAQDTDGDGVPNITDVDDDNDGILDVDEQPCNRAVYWSWIGANANANLTTDDAQTLEFVVSGPSLGSVGSILDYAQFSSYADVPTDRRNFNVDTPGTYTFDFQDDNGNSISILNPYILISSLGSLAELDYVTFSEVYEVVFVNPNGNTAFVNQQTVEATGGYFVVRFPGEHSSISIETDVDVDRFSAVWGIDCTAFPHDNDKDGIPNKEDLDSDNDGCSDANEAYADPNADGGDDGVYGTGTPNENPDGSVVGAPYTTGYVEAITYASDPTVCGARNPNTDLDDDNDGVLDTDEFTCDTGVYWADLTVTPSLGLITAGDNSITSVTTGLGSIFFIEHYGNFSGYADMPDDTRSYNLHSAGTNTFTFSDFDSTSGTYEVNTPYMILSGLGASRDLPEKVVFDIPYEVVYTSPTSDVAYADPTTIIGYGAYIVVRFPGNHGSITVTNDNNLLRTSILVGVSCPDYDFDADNDGIPNRLDTDSDGDGCSDANEAYNDPNADGGDDGMYGNGTPTENPDGTVVGASYSTGYVANMLVPGRYTICADDDNDNDGFDDRVDLDDDNDGILDTEESRCTQNVLWGFWDSPGPMQAEIATPEGMVDVTVSGPNFGTFNSIQGYSEGDFDTYPDAPSNRRSAFPASMGDYTFTFSRSVENAYLLIGGLGSINLAKSISFDRPYEVVYKNPTDDIQFGGNRILGNGGSAVIRFPGNYTNFTMRIERTNIHWISLVLGLECMPFDFDDDGDDIPNVFDLDSDGDGCSDANEAYNDPGADGGDGMEYALGSPPPVNNDGTVVGAPYTAPADADSSGTPDYREIPSSPDPIILQQPEDVSTICPGTRVEFRVVASNADQYQWQKFDSGVWMDILVGDTTYQGTDTEVLIIDPATGGLDGMRYRVVIQNTAGTVCSAVVSEEVMLTVGEDSEDPTASDPAPLVVQCDSEVPAAEVSVVLDEADNCTVPPTVTYQGETVSGNVITRTYRVSDNAGNFIDVTHTITIEDTQDPTASDPAPLNVQCESDVPAVNVNVVIDEADNCTVPPAVTFQGEVRTGNVITRTYRVSDAAGNFIDVTHTIIIEDTEDPTASDPAPLYVQCESQVPVPNISVVVDEADNCTVPPVVTYIGEARTGNLITRTYRVSDDTGNFIDLSHRVIIEDTENPTASDPALLNVQCESDVPAVNVNVVIDEADNCTVPPTVTFQEEVRTGNVITRTYRVTDATGNFIDVTHTITVRDTQNPTASDPAPLNVQCESDVPAVNVNVVIDEADNCTVPPEVTFQGEVRTGNVITRTYRVSDAAGNFIDVVHTITIEDTQDPTASDPAPLNVQCESDVPVADVNVVIDEADNCTVPPIVTFQGESRTGQTITRIYRVSDAAGNFIDVAHTITVRDSIAPVPVLTELPAATGLCPLRLEPPMAEDNCSGTVTATTNDSTFFTEAGDYTVTWVYEDMQGNRTEQQQEVVVSCDTDLTVEKTADRTTAYEGETVTFTITVTNNGSVPATKIEVWDALPNGFLYEAHTAMTGSYDTGEGIWTIPLLEPGERSVLEMETTMEAGPDHTNVVEIISMDQPDARMDNNRDEVTVLLLEQEDCLVIFNEFSPNNDGVNDYFHIECLENYPVNRLEVFNRWGTKVFETGNYRNDWDGTHSTGTTFTSDGDLPVGTYYYVLDFPEGDRNTETGWLYITR